MTSDLLGTQMAGPAIRAFEMAKVLSSVADVRLVSTVAANLTSPRFSIGYADEDRLRAHADWADVIVFQGHVLASFPFLGDDEHVLVADIYDPMHLETLEQGRELSEEDRYHLSLETAEVLNGQMERADFLLCASEKQRDFWLGQLAGLFRINPGTYDDDASLRNLIDVAPFGVEDNPPIQKAHGIKGVVPGISETDKVILWGGGIYNWFDPLTLIRAVHSLSERHPDLRLFFLGVKHPNPHVPEMAVSFQARELAIELGLLDRVVFFNSGWVPYGDRADYLLDADLGVSTHFDHLETAFSFRTRILDYLWASLPIVATEGDTFDSIIKDNNLGRTVPPEDITALEDAIEHMVYDSDELEQVRANVVAYASTLTWSQVLRPLVDFCLDPRQAPDRARGIVNPRKQAHNDLVKRVEGLEQSTSWRLTRPLRWATESFNRYARRRPPAPWR